jgi:hypothetical protein
MKIYFAGTLGTVAREKKNLTLYKRRLYSFFYIQPDQIGFQEFEYLKKRIRKKKGGPI